MELDGFYIKLLYLDGMSMEPDPLIKSKMQGDVDWCVQMLKRVATIQISHSQTGEYEACGFEALVEAMQLNNPAYRLKGVETTEASIMLGAASLSSLEYLRTLGEFNQQDEFQWRESFKTICKHENSGVKVIHLNNNNLSKCFLETVASEGRPSKLESLRITLNATQHDDDITRELKNHVSHLSPLTTLGVSLETKPHKDMLSFFMLPGITNLFILFLLNDENLAHPDFENICKDAISEFLKVPTNAFSIRQLALSDSSRYLFSKREDQIKLVEYLDFNINCSLEEIYGIEWVDTSLKKHCMRILERNKFYKDAGILEKQMKPTTGKLFICGNPGVGKSTLRKNLTRWGAAPACFQVSRSTVGIKLSTLHFGKKKLVLCDLAGQPQFHTLHHYFVRGSEKDLFLLICRVPGETDQDSYKVENQLEYWLRFIVAHRSISQHKPKVLIVLNYFPESMRPNPDTRCSKIMKDYSEHVDFAKPLGFNVKSFSQTRELKSTIKGAFIDLLNKQPEVPELCEKIIQKMSSIRRLKNAKIISLKDFQSLCDINFLHGTPKVMACIMYLHDTGEIVYFDEEKHDDTTNEDQGENFIILNAQWFLQELVGKFLPRLPRENETNHATNNTSIPNTGTMASKKTTSIPDTLAMADLQSRIEEMCGGKQYIDHILKCLKMMGIILVTDNENVRIVPLIKEPLDGWSQEDGENNTYTFWGRRFDCKNSEKDILPSGIFNMLQVKLSNTVYAFTKIGKGWIHIIENKVEVIIKIGGTSVPGEWYDKHWVDVLMRIPDEDQSFLNTGEELFKNLKTIILELCGSTMGCPCIELEEKVICPIFLKDKPGNESAEAHALSKVKQTIKDKGVLYFYTWQKSLGKSTRAIELLFRNETAEYLGNVNSGLDDIEDQVNDLNAETSDTSSRNLTKSVSKNPEIEDCYAESSSSRMASNIGSNNIELNMIMQRMEKDQASLKQRLFAIESELKSGVEALKKEITSVMERLEKVIENRMNAIEKRCIDIMSKLQLDLEFSKPKYPFLTNDNNFLQNVSTLVAGSTSTLHFLCEYEHGCHMVEDQPGLKIKTPPDWYKKAAPVLVPALRIFFFALKITTIVTLGVVIPTPESAFLSAFEHKSMDALGELVFQNVDKRVASSTKYLEELHQNLGEVLKAQNVNYGKYFGLYHCSRANGKPTWLCIKHKNVKNNHM